MTVLSVVQDVCAEVGVALPTSIFSGIGGNRTMQEMLRTANKVAQMIAYDTRDWNRLRKTGTFVGDGIIEAFTLPIDYKRMLVTTDLWRSTNTLAPMRFVPDTNEWLNRRARNYYDGYGEWTNMGGQIHVAPILAAAQTIKFAYLDKNCIALASGGTSDSFLADGDSYLIDERVLKLGMIWNWKQSKGTPYVEDMGIYDDAMMMTMGHDGPSPIITSGRSISSSRVAYPFPIPDGMVPL